MCTIAVRSVRYSTLPALDSSTARRTSIVTVPTFGLGILPWGPRMRPRRPTTGMRSGVADVEARADVDLDGLVELPALEVLDQPDRLGRGVLARAVHLLARLHVLL